MKHTFSIPILFFCTQILFIIIHVYQYTTYSALVRSRQYSEQEKKGIEKEIQHITQEIAYLKNPQHIAKHARSQLGMKPITMAQIHRLNGSRP